MVHYYRYLVKITYGCVEILNLRHVCNCCITYAFIGVTNLNSFVPFGEGKKERESQTSVEIMKYENS